MRMELWFVQICIELSSENHRSRGCVIMSRVSFWGAEGDEESL